MTKTISKKTVTKLLALRRQIDDILIEQAAQGRIISPSLANLLANTPSKGKDAPYSKYEQAAEPTGGYQQSGQGDDTFGPSDTTGYTQSA